MLYEVDAKLIQAIKNVLVIVEQSQGSHVDAWIDADMVIENDSISELKKLITSWEHDERMFDCT
jgi:hypothetical protein